MAFYRRFQPQPIVRNLRAMGGSVKFQAELVTRLQEGREGWQVPITADGDGNAIRFSLKKRARDEGGPPRTKCLLSLQSGEQMRTWNMMIYKYLNP